MGVSAEAINKFSEKGVINFFNNFTDNSVKEGPIGLYNVCNFNPLDKVVELYERLVQAVKDKTANLEKLLNK